MCVVSVCVCAYVFMLSVCVCVHVCVYCILCQLWFCLEFCKSIDVYLWYEMILVLGTVTNWIQGLHPRVQRETLRTITVTTKQVVHFSLNHTGQLLTIWIKAYFCKRILLNKHPPKHILVKINWIFSMFLLDCILPFNWHVKNCILVVDVLLCMSMLCNL